MVLLDTIDDTELAAAIASGQLSPGVGLALQYRNSSSIENVGGDGRIEGAFLRGDLRYGLDVTVARSRRRMFDGSEVDLTVTPKVFGNARLSYRLPGQLPTLAVAAAFVGRRLADRANDGLFMPAPSAPPQLELRATVSGAVPGLAGLSYRASANVAVAEHNPYVVGPTQAATVDQPSARLSPVDRFRVTVGLQYDFGR
jgi:outer membrane receptor for ferrienterochelin and colicins